MNFIKKFIGTKDFYKRVLVLMIPIMIQTGITNLVNMLDNIMVGKVGTAEMTGVAVSNQLFFVFNLCIFGAVSGAGIFGAQFFGNGDNKGVRDTFRFKVIFTTLLTVASTLLFIFFGEKLIVLYLKGEGSPEEIAAALKFAREYMLIMLIGILPYALSQCYSSTLRETGEATLPMYAGVSAVFVNLILNYILIFGHFGAPTLGVRGAAIATVISRFVELFIMAAVAHKNREKNAFLVGAYKSLRVPKALVFDIFTKGLPLMLNETLWSAGIAILNQSYSLRGYDVVSASNISQTFYNVFSTAFMAVGVAIGIIIGQMLGSGETEKAYDSARKLIAFSVFVSVIVGGAYFLASGYIPLIYNTTDEVRHLATALMKVTAIVMPLHASAHASYFTLRSGGQVIVTFLFDSCFVWLINVPVVLIICHFTSIPIIPLYAISEGLNLLKSLIGFWFVKKKTWIRNIVR